jgi:hypothetical protein
VPTGLADTSDQIDLAGVAEVGARPSRVRVQRNQASVVGSHEQATRARGVARRAPIGQTAADQLVGVSPLADVDLRIEAPQLGAGERVEGEDLVEGRAKGEHSIDQERGGFERNLRSETLDSTRPVAGVEHPGNLEASHIVRRETVETDVALSTRVVSVAPPFGSGAPLRGGRLARRVAAERGEQQKHRPNQRVRHGAEQATRKRDVGSESSDLTQLGRNLQPQFPSCAW